MFELFDAVIDHYNKNLKNILNLENLNVCKLTVNIFTERKKWKPEIKDSWITFFTSIVKVMKKNEMKVSLTNNEAVFGQHCFFLFKTKILGVFFCNKIKDI